MNRVLEIKNLQELMQVIHARIEMQKSIKMSPYLCQLEQIYLSVDRGCACTRNNRLAHAEACYRDLMITLPFQGKQELKKLLGIGEDEGEGALPTYDRAVIMSNETLLLEL